MEETKLTLQNPPIIEAVLDIDCDLPPGLQLSAIESAAKECFDDRYPKFRTQFVQEHQITAPTSGSEPTVSIRQGVRAFQFLQDDERQLVQVSETGFSFNRLAPYTDLDDYLPEIERSWHLYLNLCKPVKVIMIRLRYINRILLPLTAGKVELDDYFKVAPRLADEDNLGFIKFLSQYAAIEINTGNQVNSVLASQPAQGDTLPIIFDNGVLALDPGEPDEWDWILGKIQSLRDLKNRIFKNTVTEQCLNLFQQP